MLPGRFVDDLDRIASLQLHGHLSDNLLGLSIGGLKFRVAGQNVRAADLHPIALMLYRQIKRPMIAHVRRHLEARWLQSLLTCEDTYVLHSLVAGESVDVRDDLVLFPAGVDKLSRSVADFIEHPAGNTQRRQLLPAFRQPHLLQHRVAGLPMDLWQALFQLFQLRQWESLAGVHQTDFGLGEPFFF